MEAMRWAQVVDALPHQRAADEVSEACPCQSCGRATEAAEGVSYGAWRCCESCWPVSPHNVLQGALRVHGRARSRLD